MFTDHNEFAGVNGIWNDFATKTLNAVNPPNVDLIENPKQCSRAVTHHP